MDLSRHSKRANEWVEVREISCPYDRKMAKFGELLDGEEMNWKYYYMFFSPDNSNS